MQPAQAQKVGLQEPAHFKAQSAPKRKAGARQGSGVRRRSSPGRISRGTAIASLISGRRRGRGRVPARDDSLTLVIRTARSVYHTHCAVRMVLPAIFTPPLGQGKGLLHEYQPLRPLRGPGAPITFSVNQVPHFHRGTLTRISTRPDRAFGNPRFLSGPHRRAKHRRWRDSVRMSAASPSS